MNVSTRYIKELIHESNLIEGYDDPEFDEQSLIAWDYLVQQKELSQHVICKVQKIITLKQTDLQPDWRGYYRKIEVWIGGRPGLQSKKVSSAMTQWLYYYQNRSPKEAHIEFEKIHPFVDGNGRTGRMLMWWHELKLGKNPTKIAFEDRFDYYGWFK